MIRMPDGIHGQRFFQKHWEQERPDFVQTITVFSAHKDEQHAYLLCNNLPTLLWLAQSGTLEFHVWHSRARPGPDTAGKGTDYASSLAALESSVLNYPDYVVFDIDPYIYSGKEAPGAEPELNTVAFEKAKEVAFWLREVPPAHRYRCRSPGRSSRMPTPLISGLRTRPSALLALAIDGATCLSASRAWRRSLNAPSHNGVCFEPFARSILLKRLIQ